jgi:hypothetical protein
LANWNSLVGRGSPAATRQQCNCLEAVVQLHGCER